MLSVHLSDGQTLSFDLKNDDQARLWLEKICSREFQSKIRAISIQKNKVQYSLPIPVDFERIFVFAENLLPDKDKKFKGGERIVCQADDIRLSMMVHSSQRASRVTLSKTGIQCYNPIEGFLK